MGPLTTAAFIADPLSRTRLVDKLFANASPGCFVDADAAAAPNAAFLPTLDAAAPAEEATVDIADPAADAPDLTAPPAEDKTEDAAPGAIIAPASKAPPTPLAPLDIKLPAPFRAPPIRPPFVGVPGGKGGPIPPGPSLPPIRAVAYIAATDADILPKRAGNPNRFAL